MLRVIRILAWAACLFFFCSSLRAEERIRGRDIGWPREFSSGEHRVVMYQPQVDDWSSDRSRMTFLSAIEVAPKGAGPSKYGVIEIEARTETHIAERTVDLSQLRVKDLRFPNVPADQVEELDRLVRKALPSTEGKVIVASLDRINAYLEAPEAQHASVNVNLNPPKILYSDKPSILVIFMGKPEFKKVEGTDLLAAANTNWDVFLEPSESRYYLLCGEYWLTSKNISDDGWKAAKELPIGFSRLPQDPNWEDVSKHVPGRTTDKAPHVFVSTEPVELIVTDGEPKYTPIPGTRLMEVANTESALYYHGGEKLFYYLVAGRWFRAKDLKGPWLAASQNLPPDFAAIPDENENAFIKASVPGTEEAKDAVLLASIPQKTVIRIEEAKCAVTYDGSPRFVTIKGSDVKYAVNSPCDVFLVAGGYYCCQQGMWFAAPKPEGPWVLCSKVPESLYTIPSDHPKHNVTYVYVYDSKPDTVVVGYTSGYSGEFVAATGVVMFGLGVLAGMAIADDWDNDCWHWHYSYHHHCHFYSYGCGAVYHHGYGGYYRASHCYGPYGGAGRGAYYNPHTGAWARGGYVYGPGGGAGYRAGYNPFTDTYAARAVVKTPYGSSGRFYAERGNKEVWGGHESGARGSVGWAKGDDGQGIVGVDTRQGQGVVAKDREGNIYVGKDGNVYRKDADGWWSSNQGGDWKTSQYSSQKAKDPVRADGRPTPAATSDTRPIAPTTTERNSRRDSFTDTGEQLNADARSRDRGNQNAGRASSTWGGSRAGGRNPGSGGGRRR